VARRLSVCLRKAGRGSSDDAGRYFERDPGEKAAMERSRELVGVTTPLLSTKQHSVEELSI
jgi:hypothetical protein